MHPTDHPHQTDPHRLARRTPTRSRHRPLVLPPHRNQVVPRRHRAPDQETHGHRSKDVHLPANQEDHTAHPAAHHRNGTPPLRCRHHRHRALARARKPHHHPHLPTRRHSPQRESPRPNHLTEHHPGPLPRPRHPAGVPQPALITETQRRKQTTLTQFEPGSSAL